MSARTDSAALKHPVLCCRCGEDGNKKVGLSDMWHETREGRGFVTATPETDEWALSGDERSEIWITFKR